MAKPASIKIRLNSSADTGFFYVTKKNARTMTEKMVVKKYDPVVRKHVEFREGKIKVRLAPSLFRRADVSSGFLLGGRGVKKSGPDARAPDEQLGGFGDDGVAAGGFGFVDAVVGALEQGFGGVVGDPRWRPRRSRW